MKIELWRLLLVGLWGNVLLRVIIPHLWVLQISKLCVVPVVGNGSTLIDVLSIAWNFLT